MNEITLSFMKLHFHHFVLKKCERHWVAATVSSQQQTTGCSYAKQIFG